MYFWHCLFKYLGMTFFCNLLIKEHKQIPNIYTLLSFFPQTTCFSPKQVFDKHQSKGLSKVSLWSVYYSIFPVENNVAMDELVFKEKSVQRVFEYLQKNNERKKF